MVELAQKYGTPLYVIDEETLRQVCREYKSAFEKYPNVNLMYASKALCNLAITKVIDQENFGFDAVS
ncbi:MAG: diaminopimelate decarboxylase, partial [Clostridia bacterium]|nr:diaminopimelate decarboxylase [Clostridia bacterium]